MIKEQISIVGELDVHFIVFNNSVVMVASYPTGVTYLQILFV